MLELTFDLETVPCADPDLIAELTANIKPPATMKRYETIQKWEAEERPQAVAYAIAKTSLDGAYGRICCISWAVGDEDPKAIVSPSEPGLIQTFYDELSKVLTPEEVETQNPLLISTHTITMPLWIGHNISGFDLPFLRKRSVIHGIRPPYQLEQAMRAKAWDQCIGDTMLMWDADRDKRISLDRLCKVLRIPSPKSDGVDGSKVAELFAAGEYERIGEYCAGDVTAARRCYRAMTWRG